MTSQPAPEDCLVRLDGFMATKSNETFQNQNDVLLSYKIGHIKMQKEVPDHKAVNGTSC